MKKTSKAFLSTVAALTVTLSSVGMPLASIPLISTQSITAYAAGQTSTQYYPISVTGGTLSNGKTSGVAKALQLITVKADEAPEGKQFSYWVNNKTGLIVSYDSTYSFYMPSQNVDIEARYSSYDNTKYGIATARTVTADKSAKKVSFSVSLNVPEGCTYVRGGVVATNSNNIRAEVDLSNADYVKVASKGTSKTKNLTYTWTKGNANADTVWFVKGYLVYKDANGVERTSYSKCLKGNLNGDVSSQNGAILDEKNGVISLRGMVSKSDVEELKYNHSLNLKKVIAEEGSSVTGDISYLFNNYKVEEVDLSKLDTTGITDMTQMFAYTYGIKKINMNGFDTSQVTSMHWMFYDCHDLEELDMTGWDTSKVEDMDYLFAYNRKLADIDISNWNFSSVRTMLCAFYDCDSITSLDLSKSDMPNLENASLVASKCDNLKTAKFGNSTTSKLNNASSLFYDCQLLENVDVSTLNTSSVTNMNGMFQCCKKLKSIDVSGFDTSNVTNMGCMFDQCEVVEALDVSNFDTSKVTNMYSMFNSCKALKSLNVSNFNTSNVTDMGWMFSSTSGISSLDLGNFDTSKVTNMVSMFRWCSSLESLDISGFNTAKVTNMAYMFSGCTVLPYVDLSSFNYGKITKYANYSTMFDESPYLTDNVVSVYRTQLTNGYTATLRAYITVKANAAKAVVSIGDQSQEFSRDDWNLSSDTYGTIVFNFKSNATTSSDQFKIRFYDAEERPLPVICESNEYCNYAECTRSSSDVTRTYFRVTKVVGEESTYEEYNTSNKKITLNKSFLGSSTVPEGYKLYGWEVNGTVYPLSQNYEYWTGGRDTTITAVFVEKAERETIAMSLNTPVTAHYEDGDSDTLSFTAEEAGTYVFTSEGAYQMTGRLYSNSAMTDIIDNAGNNNGIGNFRITVELDAEQTVYMNNLSSKIQDYTVKVRKMSNPPVSKKTLTLNTSATGHYEDIDEYNVFSFTAAEEGVYLFSVENTEGGVSAYLYTDEALSEYIASTSSSDGSFTIRAVLTAGQTVYLKPTGYYDYYSCDYTVSVVKKVIEAREPIALTLNTEKNGTYTDPDAFDRFSFTATEAGTYKFRVENTDHVEMQVYLYSDAALTDMITSSSSYSGDYNATGIVSATLTAGQTVYFAAKATYEDQEFSYTAIVKTSQAIPLTLNEIASGYYGSSDDCDYFSFTASEDGSYRFSGQSYSEMRPELYSNPDLTGYIKSGSYSWGDNGATFSVSIDLTAGQTVYLKPVAEYSESYDFDFTVTVAKRDSNSGLSVLTLNTPTAGHFEDSDTFSYFSFTAAEAGTYYFASDCDTDTYGYLYSDADLTDEIASDDDSNGNWQFKIEYTLGAGQTVYLKPVELGEDESCDYTVTVTDYDPS